MGRPTQSNGEFGVGRNDGVKRWLKEGAGKSNQRDLEFPYDGTDRMLAVKSLEDGPQ